MSTGPSKATPPFFAGLIDDHSQACALYLLTRKMELSIISADGQDLEDGAETASRDLVFMNWQHAPRQLQSLVRVGYATMALAAPAQAPYRRARPLATRGEPIERPPDSPPLSRPPRRE